MKTMNNRHLELTGPDSELALGRVSNEFLKHLEQLKVEHDKMLIAIKQIDDIAFNLIVSPVEKLNRIKQITFGVIGFSTDTITARQEDWI